MAKPAARAPFADADPPVEAREARGARFRALQPADDPADAAGMPPGAARGWGHVGDAPAWPMGRAGGADPGAPSRSR